jgi:FAD:protein FMN transferase
MKLFEQSRNAMGTVFRVCLYSEDETHALACFESAFDEIERLEETFSKFRSSSEVSRINRLASQRPVTTDGEVFGLLEKAQSYSRRTDGAFDITVGPLMRAWGFFRAEGRLPASEELSTAREKTGFEKIEIDPASRTARFAVPEMEIDLGAIGKGYAVDRVAAVLSEAGIETALIDAGSSTIFALGAPPDCVGWTVHVPDPLERSRPLSTVTLRDQSISTSGNYERFFEVSGKRYGHIIDPRRGVPVEGVLQACLLAPSATMSDALSSAIFVMGADAGAEMLEAFEGVEAMWVLGYRTRCSVIGFNWHGPVIEEVGILESSLGRVRQA